MELSCGQIFHLLTCWKLWVGCRSVDMTTVSISGRCVSGAAGPGSATYSTRRSAGRWSPWIPSEDSAPSTSWRPSGTRRCVHVLPFKQEITNNNNKRGRKHESPSIIGIITSIGNRLIINWSTQTLKHAVCRAVIKQKLFKKNKLLCL